MKKLSLKLEELAVESFRTEGDPEKKSGTVHGHYGTNHTAADTCATCWFNGCANTQQGEHTCEYQSTEPQVVCACCPMG